MAPPAKTLERDLKKVVRKLFDAEEELTVNAVRKQVEELHGLDVDFFSAPEWKSRSKTIIKDFLVRQIYPAAPFRIHPMMFICAWPCAMCRTNAPSLYLGQARRG